ncbi:hypothetical protein H0485_21225, partial [Pseudogemmobacter sp. CC-YST710]|nr:hypothetical protein [Pseudogemmobacter faecipullorum]
MKFRILFTAALFALAAGPAHAGPIAAAVAWVGGVIAAGGAAAAIMQMALSLALNVVATAIAKAVRKAPEVSVKFEVELGDDTPLKFSLGTYATAGKRRYVGSWGWNTRFVTMVVECSSLPQGLSGVWVGDDRGEFA